MVPAIPGTRRNYLFPPGGSTGSAKAVAVGAAEADRRSGTPTDGKLRPGAVPVIGRHFARDRRAAESSSIFPRICSGEANP